MRYQFQVARLKNRGVEFTASRQKFLFCLLWLLLLPGIGAALVAQTCPLVMGEPEVGACRLEGNTSIATVSVELSWSGTAQSGELIYVELSSGMVLSADRVILNPATQTSPQTVTFDVLADGTSGHDITATSSSCTSTVTRTVTFPMNCCAGNTATVCTDGSNAATLTADAGLSQIQWYESGVAIPGATNPTLVVDASIEPFKTHLADGSATYYYEATDENGCSGILCCPVQVFTEVCYDLAFAKKLNTTATPGPFRSGDLVQYTFEVSNQGTRTVYEVDITDYVPAGLTSITYVANSASAGMITQAGNTFTLDELAGTDSNGGDPVTVSFEVTFIIDPMFSGESIVNSAEISAFYKDENGTIPAADEDSTPDDNTNGGIAEDEMEELANNDVITDVDDGALQDNDPTEDDFDAEEIVLNQLVAVGNLIFQDVNGDGKFNVGDGDFGLSGVVLELYLDNGDGVFDPVLDTKVIVGPDGIPGSPDDISGQAYLSGPGGLYFFDQLEPGNYFVYIPSVNFEPGNVLSDHVSSLPEDTGETVDDDGSENGQNTLINGGVVSGLVILELGGEPENELGFDQYPGFLDDNNVNQTIDFGFLACPQMACLDQVNVTLGPDCTFEVTPDLLLSGNLLDDLNWYTIYLVDESGQAIPGTTVTKDQANEIVGYTIYIPSCDNSPCWGEILVEDKSEPVVIAPRDTVLECWLIDEVLNNAGTVAPWSDGPGGDDDGGDGDHRNDLGVPDAFDDCGGTPIPYTFNDAVEYFRCGDDGITAVITRTFRAEDENGLVATAVQTITFQVVDYTDFAFEADTDAGDGQTFVKEPKTPGSIDSIWVLTVQTCMPGDALAPLQYPIYVDAFGREVSLNEADCNYSLEAEAATFGGVCGDGYKEQRHYNLFDWCVDGSIPVFPYLVKVGDFEAPQRVDNSCLQVLADTLTTSIEILDSLNTNALDTSILCGTVSTGPMNCTAALDISLSGLESHFGDLLDDCKEIDISVDVLSYQAETLGKIPTGNSSWVVADFQRQGDMIMGLPEGLYALFITANDDCYNTANYILFFEVEDGVKPLMKCDDELRVTLVEGDEQLGIGGYALARAVDIDEGSWDNCSLVDLQVRRSFFNDATGQARADWIAKNDPIGDDLLTDEFGDEDAGDDYTPWRDFVEFFCGDVTEIGPDDGGVRVELRGTDASGNQSICWLDVEVENGTNFGVELTGQDAVVDCTEIPVNRTQAELKVLAAKLGIEASITGIAGCQVGTAELAFDLSQLNQCGTGTIIVSIDESSVHEIETKNAVRISDRILEIEVVGDYDYWVKFPADTDYFCEDETAAGVDYETSGCDLITVYESDERFESVADPQACYKIFRTYKVINWCEYDGESQPVIVSRDWDAHNATDCGINRNANDEPGNPRQDDAGEYNLNPLEPDGDGLPGDEDIYVIVDVNNLHFGPTDRTNDGETEAIDGELDIVYYDNNADPYDQSTADLWGDDDVSFRGPYDWPGASRVTNGRVDEGYWWAVTRGELNVCNRTESSWFDDDDIADNYEATDPVSLGGFDVDGTDAQDDSDNRYGSFGYWQYTQHIVVYDDSDPEATLSIDQASLCSLDGTDCDANVSFTVRVSDPCSTVSITATYAINGTDQGELTDNGDGTYSATFEGAPLGKHNLTVTIKDGCGNVATVSEDFEVTDCKAPAPICHEDMVVELMPVAGDPTAAMAEIWASDLIASDIGDCSGQSAELINGLPKVTNYSINRLGSTATENQLGLTFDCADANDVVAVEVHAWDEAGNHDYCVTMILVQDNNEVCDSPVASQGNITGLIATEDVAPIEGTEVQLSGGRSMMYMTGESGDYSFEDLDYGLDYTIVPLKDQDHRNGVSTFDLVLIQKHILGVTLLDSPYKLIAADANNSRSISTLDLIQIRKLILNIDTEFANNTSWRFVDADYVFPDATNPWLTNFPEIRNINNLDNQTTLANFVGVKIGDVNGSAQANTFQDLAPRRIADVMEISTEEVDMKQGNVYTVSFKADMTEIAGYQFTLEVDQSVAQIVDVQEGIAKGEHFGVFTEEGVITSSFHRSAKKEIKGEVLFSLSLRATADAALSEAIGISSRYTAAEAYDVADEDLAIGLVIGEDYNGSEYALYQNRPNPFQAETVISFKLPEAMEAVLEFKDISGRTILLREGDYTKGYNEFRLKADELLTAGVYFYTLHAGDFIATKQMVLLGK